MSFEIEHELIAAKTGCYANNNNHVKSACKHSLAFRMILLNPKAVHVWNLFLNPAY